MLLPTPHQQFADAAQNDNAATADVSPERMQALVLGIGRTAGGRAMLDYIYGENKMGRLSLRTHFNPIDNNRHGVAYNYMICSDIFLDPRLHNNFLSPILFHELRHGTQPRNRDTADIKLSLENRLIYSRLIEGDAFTHQICFGLDLIAETGSKTEHLENMRYFAKMLPQTAKAQLYNLTMDYLRAENVFDKKDAMHGMYWLLQENMLGGYDARNIKKFNEFTEALFLQNSTGGLPNRSATASEKQRLFEHYAAQLLAKPVFAATTMPYIGQKPADIIQRITQSYSADTLAAIKATNDAFDVMTKSRTHVPGRYYKPQKFS